jgi:outer membrane protein assembly factor BamB
MNPHALSRFILTRALNVTLFVCLLTFAHATDGQTPAQPDPVEGKWYGMTGFPQDRVEVGFEFKRNEKQELKAYLYQPVINFYGLELPGALVKQGDKYIHEDMLMSLSFHEGKLEGTFLGLNGPISLQRTNTLPQEVPLPTLPKGPGPKWQAKLGGAIFATAAVRDGTAYVGTTGGMFYAVSLKDGSFVWPFNAGRPVYGESLLTDEHVYFVCDNGFLFKLDRKTGKEVWRYALGDAQAERILPHQVIPNSGDFDFDSSAPRPTLFEGVLYVGSGDGGLHAVNAATGQRVWRFEAQGKNRTDAIIDGPRVIFASLDNYVYAVDRLTGKEVWKKNTRGPLTSSPLLIGDRLIIGNRNGLLAALNPATGEVIWRMVFWGSAVESTPVAGEGGLFYIGSSDLRRVSLIDSKDARVLWRTDIFGWAWPRPALTDKLVYASAIGTSPYQIRHFGSLTAMDRRSGKIIWRWPMPECAGSWMNGFAASPAIDGHTLVVGGLDGTLYAFPVE